MRIRKILKILLPDNVGEFLMQKRLDLQRLINKRRNIEISNFVKSVNSIVYRKQHVFFGYYDITPFNISTDEIVYLKIKSNNMSHASIILHDLNNNNNREIATSNAWNWQQGSRLRWFPNSSVEIVFNDYQKRKYISRIINVINKQEKIIDHPIYDIDYLGKYAITLNFERLGVMRPGYGYTNNDYNPLDDLGQEAISLVDISENTTKTLITYRQIAEALEVKSTNFHNNYINHLSFSPNGNKFLFFWLTVVNGYHKADLIIYDFQSKEILPLETRNKVSHYVWLDDSCILCTVFNGKHECRYYKYWLDGRKEIVNPTSLFVDGHPSVLSDNLIITDTYPDKTGFQKICLVDLHKDISKDIINIYSQYKINPEKRTDLHPRLNKTKDKICFDANIKGNRQLFILSNESNSYSNYSL